MIVDPNKLFFVALATDLHYLSMKEKLNLASNLIAGLSIHSSISNILWLIIVLE